MRQLTQEELDSVRNNPDRLYWDIISYEYTLSEAFVREFQDKVNWDWISRKQTLSENFIREFQDKVNWDWISGNQVLSDEFIQEFQNRFGTSDVGTHRRPVTYGEIISYNPCMDGVKRYLKHTATEETITWNTLLERHSYKNDIGWLFRNRT